MDSLNTGDIILMRSNDTSGFIAVYDWLISWFTHSPYTHTAMILKDPTWIRDDLIGIYAYESSTEPEPDPEDNKRKLGVQLTPIKELLTYKSPDVYVRRLVQGQARITKEKLIKMHSATHGVPYDWLPRNLLSAAFKTTPDPNEKHTDRMFCSALVCYMGVTLGLIEDQDWSECVPGDLSCSATNNFVRFCEGVEYADDELLHVPLSEIQSSAEETDLWTPARQ